MDSISPPNRPHYPWKQGEILIADELNAAIANAGHGTRVTDWIPGGQPDGVTDLAPYFQQAIDAAADADPANRAAAPGLSPLIIPANPLPYMLGNTLYVPSNSHVIIEVGATLKAMPTRGVVPAPAGYGGGFQIGASGGNTVENVIIELYGTLDGDWLNQAGDIGGGAGVDPIVGAGVQGGIAGNPCNNVYITGKGLGVITRFKNWPVNLSHCSNVEISGINASYCGNSFEIAGLSSRLNVVSDPASFYTASTGVISFKCDPAGDPHGINVGDKFSFTAAVAPSQFLQAEYVAKTVPDDHTVTSIVPVPTVGTGPITGGRIGCASYCNNVHIVDCLVEHISDLAVVLYSGCRNSSIRGCEVRYCSSSGPTIFCDPGQPASCSDCEISDCYVHDNQSGSTGVISNQPGIIHNNCRVFNNVIHDNLVGGLVAASCDGLEVFGNSIHNVSLTTGASGNHVTSSLQIAPDVTRGNVWGNTIRDQGKPLISVTLTVGVLLSYNSSTGAVSLQTLATNVPISTPALAPHNINPGDQFNLANAYGTDDCPQLEGWQTATAGTSGSTLNFTVAPGLVFTLRRVQVRQFTYAVPVSHIVPGTYTSDASGNISLQTYQTTLGDNLPHGYPPGWMFVLASVIGSPSGTGGATDSPGVTLNGQWLAATGSTGTTLNFVIKPNATLVLTGGRVLPAAFGISLASTSTNNSDYLRVADNRIGDYQLPRNMTAAIGGFWGVHGASSGNYFGPRAAIDADVSDYSLGGINGPNYDLTYNTLVANHTVSGFVNFSGSGQQSVSPSAYSPPQGLTPGWNRSSGRGEVNFYVGQGLGAPGGFEFLQVAVIKIVTGGPNTYDPVTGNVSVTTSLAHGILSGGAFVIQLVSGTDSNDGDDIARLNGGHVANSDTTGSTLTFTTRISLTIASITGGVVVPSGTGGGLINAAVGVAGSLFANDGYGNTRLGGALVHGAIQTATLANAGTVIVPQNTSFILVNNSSSIATGTIVMPSPMAGSYQTIGSELTLRFQSAVGSLSFTGAPVAGPPTTVLSGGASFRFIQGGPGAAANTWLPCIPDVSGTPPVGGPYLPTSGGAVTGPLTVNGLLTATAGITSSGINSTPIGATTPSTGTFTNLTATGTVTLTLSSDTIKAISTQTIATVTANSVTVPAGTNYIVVQDSVHAVNTLTVGSGTLADGYDLWMNFPNGGVFAGQTLTAHGNLTLKTLGGGWSILSKFG